METTNITRHAEIIKSLLNRSQSARQEYLMSRIDDCNSQLRRVRFSAYEEDVFAFLRPAFYARRKRNKEIVADCERQLAAIITGEERGEFAQREAVLLAEVAAARYDGFTLTEDCFLLKTRDVAITHGGVTYPLGKFQISVCIARRGFGNVEVRSITHPDRAIAHPHVTPNYNPCFGNAQSALIDDLSAGRLASVAELLHAWINDGYNQHNAYLLVESIAGAENTRRQGGRNVMSPQGFLDNQAEFLSAINMHTYPPCSDTINIVTPNQIAEVTRLSAEVERANRRIRELEAELTEERDEDDDMDDGDEDFDEDDDDEDDEDTCDCGCDCC